MIDHVIYRSAATHDSDLMTFGSWSTLPILQSLNRLSMYALPASSHCFDLVDWLPSAQRRSDLPGGLEVSSRARMTGCLAYQELTIACGAEM